MLKLDQVLGPEGLPTLLAESDSWSLTLAPLLPEAEGLIDCRRAGPR